MPKFLIERNIPDLGKFTPEQLTAASQTSCSVLRNIGPEIQWVQSYVTANKLFCIDIAPSEELIPRHATESGFPPTSSSPSKPSSSQRPPRPDRNPHSSPLNLTPAEPTSHRHSTQPCSEGHTFPAELHPSSEP
jgi:hypothetical protein